MPTSGWVSRTGVFLNSWSLDRVGVFARSIDDVVAMASAVSAYDPTDPMARRTTWVGSNCPDPLRIGVVSDLVARANPEGRRAVELAVRQLADSGAHIRPIDALPMASLFPAAHSTIMRSEIAALHDDLYRSHSRAYGPAAAAIVEAGRRVAATEYLHAQRVRAQFRLQLDELLESVDAILLPPALGPAERGYKTTGDPVMCLPATFGGLPAITLPVSLSAAGLPLGIQLVAGADQDTKLLGIAHHFESLTQFRPQGLVDRWAAKVGR
jgi:Asp-tRNA(Asn)/Glu-tRNA(Gln) amidotransferase A subunit family amidase